MEETISVSYKRSFVIGCLLGDASSRRRDLKRPELVAEFAVAHSLKQEDFVIWKAEKFSLLFGYPIRVYRSTEWNRAYFTIRARGRIRVIHDWFHKAGRKSITDKIRFLDHPVGLAMLLCDDGSVQKRKKAHADGSTYYLVPALTIATHCFTKEEVERLLLHLATKFGVKGYINVERRWRKGTRQEYQRVRFNGAETGKLWSLVKLYIPEIPSMQQKFAYLFETYPQQLIANHSFTLEPADR